MYFLLRADQAPVANLCSSCANGLPYTVCAANGLLTLDVGGLLQSYVRITKLSIITSTNRDNSAIMTVSSLLLLF